MSEIKDKFKPKEKSPLPWILKKGDVWHGVVASNGKRVCNCRNIKDAEFIIQTANKTQPTK